jgi:hypothetical protein
VESQQPIVTIPQPVYSDKGIPFSALSVPKAAHTAMELVPSLRSLTTIILNGRKMVSTQYVRRHYKQDKLLAVSYIIAVIQLF